MAENVLDTLSLSDEYRKTYAKRTGDDHFVVDLARQFAVMSTHWEHSLPRDHRFNQNVFEYMYRVGQSLTHYAQTKGHDGLVLPLEGVSDFGRFIKTNLCGRLSDQYGLVVRLQCQPFYPDYFKVDPAIKTCLDDGVRGVVYAMSPSAQEYEYAA